MKKRLDLIVSEKIDVSRSKAQAMIMAHEVSVNGVIVTKPGQEFSENSEVMTRDVFPYVSRGALKIKKAVKEFEINLNGKIICDIGASTGGFTDYVLQNGAKKVYAVDSGYGQLDLKLRRDSRVVNMERTNIKKVHLLPDKIDLFVVDVSFISLKKVLPICKEIQEDAPVIALIKPQFEVGKKIADKNKGVVRDKKIQLDVVKEISEFAESIRYKVKGLTESPITGAKGNVEFLIYLTV